MPSPIAHSAAGIAVWQLLKRKDKSAGGRLDGPLRAAFIILLANIPDLDFIPQILSGERFHHGASHSLIITIAFGLVAAALARSLLGANFSHAILLIAMIYGAHVFLDTLGGGPGVQLWWPFNLDYVRAPLMVFPPVHYTRGLLDRSHLRFLAFETIFSALLLTGVIAWRRWRNGQAANIS